MQHRNNRWFCPHLDPRIYGIPADLAKTYPLYRCAMPGCFRAMCLACDRDHTAALAYWGIRDVTPHISRATRLEQNDLRGHIDFRSVQQVKEILEAPDATR